MPAGHGLRSRTRDLFSRGFRKKGYIPLTTYLRTYKVRGKILKKRIHVRIEHVLPSRCTEELALRKKKNDELKAAAKARGEVISTKRQPKGPKPGFMVEGATLETVTPIPYDVTNDLKGGY
ncbi:60S ribosomal protein L21-1 [Linum perenne]